MLCDASYPSIRSSTVLDCCAHPLSLQVRRYSGGMKRRLSVAISFIGSPLVVYLDEPSTGLDPASRQNLWSVVKAAKEERAIILTTHRWGGAGVQGGCKVRNVRNWDGI